MAYAEMLKEFKKWVVSDAKAQKYWDKVNSGVASYQDADNYAELVGKKWSEMLVREYGEADYSEVISEIKSSLGKAYGESAYFAKNVQQNINTKAKIGMKTLEPKLDDDRINNFIDKLTSEDADWLLEPGAVSNIARSAVTDTIEANARIQQEAGIYAYVKRDGSNCCKWCESLTGTYEFGTQPEDFWRVHKDCTCIIEYKPSKYKKAVKIRHVKENGKYKKITT